MSYTLNKSNGTLFLTLQEGYSDNSTNLTFVGRNYVGFGTYQNSNFLHLLENFASSVSPDQNSNVGGTALIGQLWFNTTNSRLNVYDGSNWNQMPSVLVGSTATNQTNGDIWFNTTTNQLNVQYNGSYVSIGPFSNVPTATALQTARTINGVAFDGTNNITITADTPNTLTPGSFITGNSFNGSASTTWSVDVGSVNTATALKVVARDSVGDIWYNVGHGVATSSQYADLAEKYLADKEYPVGTVMMVGGPKEVTASRLGQTAIGVVSENPAYMMNSELVGGTYIALKGRVKVRVYGPVRKGDPLTPDEDGYASTTSMGQPPLGIALESCYDHTGIVEAVIL
jgi:hypothetical protein